MKTNSFILGAAALMLATSCSNDEVVQVAENSQAIGFSSFINKATRATDATTANLTSFAVYGLFSVDNNVTTVFANQEVNKDDNGWGYTPVKYWVPSATYTFGAVAPYGAANVTQGTTMTRGGIESLAFNNEDGTVDLLYADDTAEGKSVVYGSTYEFQFGHILSRVKFEFTNLIKGHALEVTEISLNGADNKAVYTPNNETKWAVATDNVTTTDYAFTPESVKALASATSTSDPTYLIPTNGSRQLNVTFKVNLYVVDEKDNTNMVLVSEEPHTLTATLNLDLNSGYSYLLKTSITNENIEDELKPIEFNATVEPWTDAAETNFTLN